MSARLDSEPMSEKATALADESTLEREAIEVEVRVKVRVRVRV